MDENKKVNTEVVQNDEFSKSAVPVSARKSFMSVLIISLGYVFVVTSMQAGSTIGVGLSFKRCAGQQSDPDDPLLHYGHHCG